MARTSYSFQKRQKELAKKKKQEEKKQRKLEKKGHGGGPEVEGLVVPAEQEPVEEQSGAEEPAERPKPGVIPPS